MNTQNLIPANKRSLSEARENGKKGGKKSGEIRREKRKYADVINLVLQLKAKGEIAEKVSKSLGIPIEEVDNRMVAVFSLFNKAIKGDSRAFEVMRDTGGEKPVDKLSIETTPPTIINNIPKSKSQNKKTIKDNV